MIKRNCTKLNKHCNLKKNSNENPIIRNALYFH